MSVSRGLRALVLLLSLASCATTGLSTLARDQQVVEALESGAVPPDIDDWVRSVSRDRGRWAGLVDDVLAAAPYLPADQRARFELWGARRGLLLGDFKDAEEALWHLAASKLPPEQAIEVATLAATMAYIRGAPRLTLDALEAAAAAERNQPASDRGRVGRLLLGGHALNALGQRSAARRLYEDAHALGTPGEREEAAQGLLWVFADSGDGGAALGLARAPNPELSLLLCHFDDAIREGHPKENSPRTDPATAVRNDPWLQLLARDARTLSLEEQRFPAGRTAGVLSRLRQRITLATQRELERLPAATTASDRDADSDRLAALAEAYAGRQGTKKAIVPVRGSSDRQVTWPEEQERWPDEWNRRVVPGSSQCEKPYMAGPFVDLSDTPELSRLRLVVHSLGRGHP